MSRRRPGGRAIDGILLLDKPEGISSNAALQRVRRLFGATKAGHTGSLDPIATGVLPICLGRATRLTGYLLDADKRYRATVQVGARTDTGDRQGNVVARSDSAALTRDALEAVIPEFLGVRQQVPPMFSALKRDGVPLYALARKGIEVPREARWITVYALRITRFSQGTFEFEVHCSKGTYVRTLAEDWAATAGQNAHLVALRRTALGHFDESALVPLERLERLDRRDLDALLLPPAAAVEGWPRTIVDAGRVERLAHGQAVQAAEPLAPGPLAVFGDDGKLLGIAEVDAEGKLAPKRWFVTPAGEVIGGGTCG